MAAVLRARVTAVITLRTLRIHATWEELYYTSSLSVQKTSTHYAPYILLVCSNLSSHGWFGTFANQVLDHSKVAIL